MFKMSEATKLRLARWHWVGRKFNHEGFPVQVVELSHGPEYANPCWKLELLDITTGLHYSTYMNRVSL